MNAWVMRDAGSWRLEGLSESSGAPVLLLADSIYAGLASGTSDLVSRELITALQDVFSLTMLTGIGVADMRARSVQADSWQSDARRLAAWLDAGPRAATHLVGIGDAAALALTMVLECPRRIGSISLVNPLLCFPAADVMLDPVSNADIAPADADPARLIAASQLTHARKAMLFMLRSRIGTHGMPCPVHLLFDHAVGQQAGFLLVEAIDFFDAGESRIVLDVVSKSGNLGAVARDWISSCSAIGEMTS